MPDSQALDARLPQFDQTEFSGHKETIEGDEKQRTDKGNDLNQSGKLRQQKLSV
ncbi:hypothetical protein [Paraburkholderia xenovorans]|uniref:hypothetical protein n=1 Tax=Paraburkholderia xenovorans TaxID=36873 RepID=UPI003457F3F8